jgi:acetyl-CoA carboxylase biotin carboxyl carrier protein
MDITAPMVGKVVKVLVEAGAEVEEDEPVVMIEAMKVEMPVVAPDDGTIKSIAVKEGDTVEADQVLAVLEED